MKMVFTRVLRHFPTDSSPFHRLTTLDCPIMHNLNASHYLFHISYKCDLQADSKHPATMWSTGRFELLAQIWHGFVPFVGATKYDSSPAPASPLSTTPLDPSSSGGNSRSSSTSHPKRDENFTTGYYNHFMFISQLRNYITCGRHSSVVSSEPTILQPWVRIPSTPSTLFFNLY